MSEESTVCQCLELLGLQEFAVQLVDLGFDRLHDILCLDEDDFAKLICDEEIKTRYKTALQQDPRLVKIWLNSLGLGLYNDQLLASGFTSLARCSGLSLQALDSVNFNLVGHKKRLFKAAQSLLGCGTVMAEGAWDEHEQFRGGRFGKFLCLTADIFPRDPRDARNNQDGCSTAVPHRRLKFMIDSGSDTVTVHEDVIRELRLPIKGAVRQEVAGGKILEKPLHSAYLGIGEKTLDIEVVPDDVNTLGTPVLWEFRHCINGEKHLWLAKHDGDS